MNYISSNWDVIYQVVTLGLLALSILVSAGLFVRRKRALKELLYIEQERDNFRIQNAKQSVRLSAVDPERFIDRINDLRRDADFDKAEEAARAFSNAQNAAFGLAAEVLTEQRILDSGEQGEWAVKEAQRFAAIGLAANPDSARLKELQNLADTRAEGLARGEPIEKLDWDGMSGEELNRLARALAKEGKYQLAEIAARRSVLLAFRHSGHESKDFGAALAVHADCLRELGDYDQAELLIRQALEIEAKVLGTDHFFYAISLGYLAILLYDMNDPAAAEPPIRQALKIDAKALGTDHPQYAVHLNVLATLLQDKGDYAAAAPLYRQALDIDAKTIGTDHPGYASHLNNLAGLLKAMGNYSAAEPLFQQAVSVSEAALGADHPQSMMLRANLEKFLHDKP